MAARYLLCPGWVTSRTDGQDHHIGAGDLAALYGVSMPECLVLPGVLDADSRGFRDRLLSRVESGELIALRPRYDEDYSLPTSKP